MTQWILNNITFNKADDGTDWELFNTAIAISIINTFDKKDYLFYLRIISTKWIKEHCPTDTDFYYIKCALILKYYDEQLIRDTLEEFIKTANRYGQKKAFTYLTHHLAYNNEELLY